MIDIGQIKDMVVSNGIPITISSVTAILGIVFGAIKSKKFRSAFTSALPALLQIAKFALRSKGSPSKLLDPATIKELITSIKGLYIENSKAIVETSNKIAEEVKKAQEEVIAIEQDVKTLTNDIREGDVKNEEKKSEMEQLILNSGFEKVTK